MADSAQNKATGPRGGKPKQPFLAFSSDGKDIEILKEFARAQHWSEDCILNGDIRTAIEHLRSHASPLILLVEVPSAADAPKMFDALADVCDPGTKVVVSGNINEYSFYCWLLEIGILSYLLRPLTLAALDGVLQKAAEPSIAGKVSSKPPAKIFAVMGTRGGSGSTTTAINLATLIADGRGLKTALVDLDPRHGSMALDLDLEASRGLREALEKPDRIDSLFLDRVMVTHHPGLSVLGAEEALHERIMPHEQSGEMLMKEMREKFDCIVLDVPREMGIFSRGALRQSDTVLLVTRLTLAGLRDGLRIHDLLREAFKMKPPLVVANAVGQGGKNEVTPADYEKGVNCKISWHVPYAPEVFIHPEAQPAVTRAKQSPPVKVYHQMLDALLPLEGDAAKKEDNSKKMGPKKMGLFSRGKG